MCSYRPFLDIMASATTGDSYCDCYRGVLYPRCINRNAFSQLVEPFFGFFIINNNELPWLTVSKTLGPVPCLEYCINFLFFKGVPFKLKHHLSVTDIRQNFVFEHIALLRFLKTLENVHQHNYVTL